MGSRFEITAFVIKPEKVLAKIDDLYVHKAASQSPAVFFSGIH